MLEARFEVRHPAFQPVDHLPVLEQDGKKKSDGNVRVSEIHSCLNVPLRLIEEGVKRLLIVGAQAAAEFDELRLEPVDLLRVR